MLFLDLVDMKSKWVIQKINHTGGGYLYIFKDFLLKYRVIFLRVLKLSDERLGESNTERRVKISSCISNEGT